MIFFRRVRKERTPAGFLPLLICAACIIAIAAPTLAAEKPRIQVKEYVIDADLAPKTHHITAKAKIKFTALDDISTAAFELNNALRVTRVTIADREINFIQEARKQDGSFYVIMPEPMARGQVYKLSIEYQGDKVVEDAGGGNFTIGARTSWYPSVNAFNDRATFDLTFKVPSKYTLVGVGKLIKSWREGDYAASQWVSEVPLAVAGFNYGLFKKKEITDPDTKYQIEGYATSEVPSYLRHVEMMGGESAGDSITPTRLIATLRA